MNVGSSIFFLKLMLIFSNCHVRRSDRYFYLLSTYTREVLEETCVGKGIGMEEKLPIGHLTTTGPKRGRHNAETDERVFFFFTHRRLSLVSLQRNYNIRSHLYTSQTSFQGPEWMPVALNFVARPQFRNEFSRGEKGLYSKGYTHKLCRVHLSLYFFFT